MQYDAIVISPVWSVLSLVIFAPEIHWCMYFDNVLLEHTQLTTLISRHCKPHIGQLGVFRNIATGILTNIQKAFPCPLIPKLPARKHKYESNIPSI